MPIEPNEYLGRIPLTEDGPILPPELVARMLEELTDAEMDELEAFAPDLDSFVLRASEWLTRRFDLQFRKRQ
jgi:hypothetical protein